MILVIRENTSKQTVEFLWNYESDRWKSKRPYFEKPIAELESFWRAWESIVFRLGSTAVDSAKEDSEKWKEEIQKKSEWLAGLVGWKQIEGEPNQVNSTLVVQSDTKWISLPWELLTEDKKGDHYRKNANRQLVREFLLPHRGLPLMETDKAFFLFQTEFGGNLEISLEREYDYLKNLKWKKLHPQFFKNAMARVERLKEILPQARIFHLGSHLQPGEWTLPDGSRLENSEIESMNLSGLELIFLNGCYSAFGLAQTFLRSGAREVVGFSTAVPNEVSEIASRTFWTEWNRSGSTHIAYQKVVDTLEGSILRYSWIRFGEVQRSNWKRNPKYRVTFAILVLASVAGLFMGFENWINRTESNLEIKNDSNSIEIDSKKDLIDLKKEPVIKKVKSKDSHLEEAKKVQPIRNSPSSEEKSVITKSYNNNEMEELLDDLLKELPNDFQINIRTYLEDENEILPPKKRILQVRRILEMNRSLEWKQDVFHRETGR